MISTSILKRMLCFEPMGALIVSHACQGDFSRLRCRGREGVCQLVLQVLSASR